MGFGLVTGFNGLIKLSTTGYYITVLRIYTLYKPLLQSLQFLGLQQALPGNGSQSWRFLSFRTHVLTGWRLYRNKLIAPKSKSCYDRRSVGKSVLVSNPVLSPRPYFCYCRIVSGLLMWGALSGKSAGPLFTIAAGPRQSSHSRVRASLDS
jgi:hypothetical protein